MTVDVVSRALKLARSHIEHAAAAADRNPTDAQKAAGNYKLGRLNWHGLHISIENAKGSKRSGASHDGRKWTVTMPASYGYVRRTEGADEDHVDVYIGPNPLSPNVWVIDQIDAESRRFDEHKCMLGFETRDAALSTYRKAFSDGRGNERIGTVTQMNVPQFKRWVNSGDTRRPLG